MGTWEGERPVFEEEQLSPQQKEEMVQEAKKRSEMDYERGRKAVKRMLAVYSVTQALFLAAKLRMMPAYKNGGDGILAWFLSLALAVALVYNIWHGRLWARIFFAVLLGVTILTAFQGISELDTTRADYGSQQSYNGSATLYFSEDGVKTIQELSQEEIAHLQKSEDIRAKNHRIIFAAYLLDLAVCIFYLYILFGYRPAKEFFYRQS